MARREGVARREGAALRELQLLSFKTTDKRCVHSDVEGEDETDNDLDDPLTTRAEEKGKKNRKSGLGAISNVPWNEQLQPKTDGGAQRARG